MFADWPYFGPKNGLSQVFLNVPATRDCPHLFHDRMETIR